MISQSELERLIKDKRDMYDSLVRNRFHMPAYKQRICTKAFMQEVRVGLVWVPKKQQIIAHTCP